jgi:hypothetical protein
MKQLQLLMGMPMSVDRNMLYKDGAFKLAHPLVSLELDPYT